MGKCGFYHNEGFCDYPDFKITDKKSVIRQHINYMLSRTQSMFEYTGLPDTIPARMLELYLQRNGSCFFYRHNGKLYVFTGGLGGEPDEYYRPTIYTISNPYLQLSVNAKVGVDGVLALNDSLLMGLLPLFSRYATALCENEISLNLASINARVTSIITAQTDSAKQSADEFLNRLFNGSQGVIMDSGLTDAIHVNPYANSGTVSTIKSLIEHEQYLKASWFNELGLNANYNMKRSEIHDAESEMNVSALLPLVDDMLSCRQEFVDNVNAMFGTQIAVSLASSWEDIQEEIDDMTQPDSVRTEDGNTPDEPGTNNDGNGEGNNNE